MSKRWTGEARAHRSTATNRGRYSSGFLGERPNVVDELPDVLVLGAVAFRRHILSLAIPDNVEQFAVGAIFQGVRLSKVGYFLNIRRHVALAITVFAMTHCAVIAIELLGVCV